MIGTLHIVVAMKPLAGSFVDNARKHGVAGLNIDGVRIEGSKGAGVWGTSNKTIKTDRKFNASPEMTEYRSEQHFGGRFPANVILEEGRSVGIMDEQSGITKSGAMKHEVGAYRGDSVTPFLRGRSGPSNQHGDTGGASRFFKRVRKA